MTRFSNGSFVSLSEGEADRIGSLFLSVKTLEKIDSMTIIPGKYAGVFPTVLSQLIVRLTGGLALLSLYLSADIDEPIMRALIAEVKGVFASQVEKSSSS